MEGQFLNKVTMPVVATTGAFGAADAVLHKVVDVPVIKQRHLGFANSESASESVHRPS